MAIRFPRSSEIRDHSRAFTLLEVALIVAIIGMILLIIVGYLLAPKQTGPLPPVAAPVPILPPSTPPPATPAATVVPVPAATPAPPTAASPQADVVPAKPAGSTPQPLPTFR